MLVPAERFELPTNGLQNSWSSGKPVSCIRVNVLSSAPPRPQECTNRDALLGARVRKPHRDGGGRAAVFWHPRRTRGDSGRARARRELFGGVSDRRSDERSISSS